MSQDQWIILLLRIIIISNIVSIIIFVGQYWRLAPWWKNPIGRTIVIKDLLLILILIPSVLSLFFTFNRLTSHIAAWVDVVLLGALTPVMVWRTVVWQRIHREKQTNGV
jgi:hypothetical protein